MYKKLFCGLMMLTSLLASTASSAASIDFEDITTFTKDPYSNSYFHTLTTEYGVHWGSGRYDQPEFSVVQAGSSVAHSGNNLLTGPLLDGLNIKGRNISLTSMWARVCCALPDNSSLYVAAYKDGKEIDRKVFAITDSYQLLNINLSGADYINIFGLSYGYLMIDDMVLSAGVVPEPETYTMLLLGLGLISAAARRRRADNTRRRDASI
ncbi:PEP-CTERM sorting domain-containing protein [Oxalobacteraceae bacterium A2-2]